MLHNRKHRDWLIDADDRSTAFAVVPANIYLIEIAVLLVLSRNDTFISMAFKEEISVEKVAILVQIDGSDYWCGEAHGEYAHSVWQAVKGDRYTWYLNTLCRTGSYLNDGEV